MPVEARLPDQDRSFGLYLAQLSTGIRAWTEKTWNAASSTDRKKQDMLELYLTGEAKKRQRELIETLETGPKQNRVIAAAALGFTREEDVLSPLLNALEDPEPDVVSNALLGLSLLQSPRTPLGRVSDILRYDPNERMRWSAAYALRVLIEAGARDKGALDAARAGLADEEPMVRSQCSLILALLSDAESIPSLTTLVYDEVPLVGSAAALALAHIGREVPGARRPAARALAQAMRDGDRALRVRLIAPLRKLSGQDFGMDVAAWSDWAATQ